LTIAGRNATFQCLPRCNGRLAAAAHLPFSYRRSTVMHWIKLLLAATVMSFLVACGGDDDDDAPPPPVDAPLNLLQTLQADARFTTLVEAVNAAALADTLAGPEALTLFAPTNEAFDALLLELGLSKEQLLADTVLLTDVLTYHVLLGQVASAAIEPGKAITPVQGGFFKIDDVAGALVVTDGRNRTANIAQVDLAAANGVIHVVDKVLLPANQDIVETLAARPEFSILVEAATAANLLETLAGAGPLTLMAPNDDAFNALFTELQVTKEEFLADTALLTSVLTYHLVDALLLKAELPLDAPITTAQGETFQIASADLTITDQRARISPIVQTDVLASNGTLHTVGQVLLPAEPAAAP
jgi:uncharacterized surface protein with fasciclin (FAS1) repeats